jgi:hypothetical protein
MSASRLQRAIGTGLIAADIIDWGVFLWCLAKATAHVASYFHEFDVKNRFEGYA